RGVGIGIVPVGQRAPCFHRDRHAATSILATCPSRSEASVTDFNRTRALFHIPPGVIYLDGNSLGPLPVAAADRAARMLREEWGDRLIRGWNDCGWYVQPRRVGDRIARLIGAGDGEVVMGDTLT